MRPFSNTATPAPFMSPHKLLRTCGNWQDFKAHISGLPRKEKGSCFEALVKRFLELHPKYATQLSHIWHLKRIPEAIRTRLNLPAPDEGIDLIAETKEGGYWAIQCKYREDENSSLGRDELSTFTDLAFGVCKNIELALVCTTTERFSHKLKLYGERLSVCAADVWRELDEEFFWRLHQLLDGKAAPIEPSAPRPHQQRALEDAYVHFVTEGNARGKLIMPCGTGKSLAAYWIAEKIKARTILVAVPSLALVRQTLEVWTREALAHRRDMHWMAVCSDESVGDVGKDDVAVLTQDLGIRVHTDPDEIAAWLGERGQGTTVVFTTYHSGPATAEAARKAGITFDVGIMDEAHKTVGRKNNLFGHLLHEENIGIAKRLFMTATERYYKGNSDDIASMHDPNLYGETFHLLSFRAALESQPSILTDYKIVTIAVTRSEVAELVARNAFVRPDRGRWNEDVEAEMFAAVIALRKAMRDHPICHAVSFHQSIARARLFKGNIDAFSVAFPEYGPLATFHVAGTTPTAERSRVLDTFSAAERGLVTNARCLTEGVDVPDIDCVLFADPKKSAVDIVQAVGRALRTADDKLTGYVVVPVLLEAEDLQDPLVAGTTQFDAVLAVLRALAASDDRIVDYFRTVAEGKKRTGIAAPFEIEIPAGMVIDTARFVESIELRLWPKLAKLSWRPFEDARRFVRDLGLKNRAEWQAYSRSELPEKGTLPDDIPREPGYLYKDSGWVSWGDWFGTGAVAPSLREFRPFEDARRFARSLGLRSIKEWRAYSHGNLPDKGVRPEDIPSNPNATYKHSGWANWGDWLGTGTVASYLRKYRTFEEARRFVHSLGFKGQTEWKAYCQGKIPDKGTLPEDIPVNAHQTYKESGWTNWGDWFGTGTVGPGQRTFRSFEDARRFVRDLGLKSGAEWKRYCKGELPEKGTLPEDIPREPGYLYKDRGWVGWGDWLGTGTVAAYLRKYRSFEEARRFVHSLGLKSVAGWKAYCHGKFPDKDTLPEDIPINASQTYKDSGWVSWGDWLGTGTIAPRLREFRSFEEARRFVRDLGLKSGAEWKRYCRGELPEKGTLPDDIPREPVHVYKDSGWAGLVDWLGVHR